MEKRALRIRIKDLPKDLKVTAEEMRRVRGGQARGVICFDPQPEPPGFWDSYQPAPIISLPSLSFSKW